MPIISIDIKKTVDKREMKNTSKEKQRQKGAMQKEAIVKGWELSGFVGHLKYVFSSWYVRLL